MSDERFARQYRFGLPSGFPLTSSCTSIVHHLSGPNIYALASHFTKDHVQPEVQLPSLPLISLRIRVYHPNTRTHVRLLGPCFKTGRDAPITFILVARWTTQATHKDSPAIKDSKRAKHATKHRTISATFPPSKARRPREHSPTTRGWLPSSPVV